MHEAEPGRRDVGIRAFAGVAARGFAMGSADVVPGVSGGTVALVTGIYARLVASISAGSRALTTYLKGDFRAGTVEIRSVDWPFLGALAVGAGVAVVTLARVIEELLASQPIRMAALFFGLIGGTIIVARGLIDRVGISHSVVAGIVGLASFALFGLQSSTVADPSMGVFFGAGVLAVCAFILPGVSGSFLLLSIGMYQPVLGAVNDRELPVVVVFALGAIVGLAAFSRVLERLLARHHDIVVAGLIGLMLGSTRILWPWPNGLGDEEGRGATVLGWPADDVVIPIVVALAAGSVVVLFVRWAERRVA